MQGKSDTWAQGAVRPEMQWEEFVRRVIDRFESKSTLGVVGEFNKLRQWSDVESYRCKFEELKLLMLRHNPILDEAYFVTSYLSGLKEDLRLVVMSNRPRTLEEAYEISVYQELIQENRKNKMQPKPNHSFHKPVQTTKSNNTHV